MPLRKYKKLKTKDIPADMLEESAQQWEKDAAQEEAIAHKQGPLLVVAGAGTGKTRVITRRIAKLIADKTCEPSEIIALTFSEKAAREMEKRVDEMVPYGMIDTRISTFHSFGHDIINESFADLKIAPDWKLLKDADAIIMIVENIDRFNLSIYKPLNNPAQYVAAMTDFVSKLKDNLITAAQYTGFAAGLAEKASTDEEKETAAEHQELARFYAVYEELKTAKNYMDYGDLIMAPYLLFMEKKSVLAKYQEKFKYILIDEFQDTNYAQFELIKLLAGKYRNITVVGDDDQMIYRFRGAAISNIMGFKGHYKDSKVIVLKSNYRSAQDILDAAYKLIQNNTDRLEIKLGIEKKLESKYSPGHKISRLNVKFFADYSEEADFVVSEIERMTKAGMYDLKDFAILVRAKNDAKMFLKTLERKGINYRFTGDEGLYNKKEVQFLINFCRSLATPYEFNPVFDVAVSRFYGISPFAMSKIGNRAKDYSLPPYELMKKLDSYPELELDDGERYKIMKLVEDISRYSELAAGNFSAGEIIYDYMKSRNVFSDLLKADTVESNMELANVSKFFEIMKQFSVNEDYDTVYNFVHYIDLRQKAGDNPRADAFDDVDENAVQVATVHKAKGLEFKVVFVVALIQDKFPVKARSSSAFPLPEAIMHDLVDEKQYQQEEERRLFYVAMTRAQDALYLTASKQYEGAANKKISIFLREIGVSEPAEGAVKKLTAEEKMRYFEKKERFAVPGAERKNKMITVSNYQLDDYITCPFKYKLIHVLRLPIREQPNIIYGQAMHRVASEFFRARQEKRQITLEDLKYIFNSLWKPVGFISQQHEKQRFEKGIQNIERFYEIESRNTIVPKYIEKDFDFKLSDSLMVIGRWDRIDETEGKSMIIDYKTSNVKNMEEAEEKISTASIFNQLKLYALAYEKVFGKPVDEVGVYFLESCILASKKIRKDTLERHEQKIYEVAEEVKKGDFTASPSSFVCSQCAFYNICPYSKANVLF
jgi:DNA helicase II / ATP-dependent DNA helicase PcrA